MIGLKWNVRLCLICPGEWKWCHKSSLYLFSNPRCVSFCRVFIGCRDYRKWRHAVRSILIGWFTRIAWRGAWWLSLWVRVRTWRLRGWIAGRSPESVAASVRTRSPGSPRSSCSSAGALLLYRKREIEHVQYNKGPFTPSISVNAATTLESLQNVALV